MSLRARRKITRFQPRIESLESRLCPAVDAFLQGNTLLVQGDALDNNIQIQVRAGEVTVLGDRGAMESFTNVAKVVINADAGNDRISVSDLNIRSGDTEPPTPDLPTDSWPTDWSIGAGAGNDTVAVRLLHKPFHVHVDLGAGADHLMMNLGNTPLDTSPFADPPIEVTDGMAVDAFRTALTDGTSVGSFRVVTGGAGITDGTLINFSHAVGRDGSTGMAVDAFHVAKSHRDGMAVDAFHTEVEDGAAVDAFHAEGGGGKSIRMAVDAFHAGNSDGTAVDAFHAMATGGAGAGKSMATGGAGAGNVMSLDLFHNTNSDGSAVDAFHSEGMAVDAFRTALTDGTAVDMISAHGGGGGSGKGAAEHDANTLIGMLNEAYADGFLPAEFMPVTNTLIELLRKAGDTELLPAVRSQINALIGLLRTGDQASLPAIQTQVNALIGLLHMGDTSTLIIVVKGEMNALIGMLRTGDTAALLPAVHNEINALIGLLRDADSKALLPAVRGELEALIGLLHDAEGAGIAGLTSEIDALIALLRKAGG